MSPLITKNIAQAFCVLNPSFSVVPDKTFPGGEPMRCQYTEVKNADGASINFYHDSYRKKVNISGNFPRAEKYGDCTPLYLTGREDEAPSMKAGEHVDPMKTAKRFSKALPLYLELFALCGEEEKKTQAEKEKTQAICSSVFPGHLVKDRNVVCPGYKGLNSAYISSNGEVDMTLKCLPAELARKIAKLVADENLPKW